MKKSKFTFPLGLTEGQMIGGGVYLALEFLILPSLIRGFAASVGIRSEALMNVLFYAVNFISCVWIFRKLLAQSLTEAGKAPARFLAAVALGFAAYEAALRVINLAFAHFAPEFSNVNDSAIWAMIAQYPVLMSVSLVVLTPVAEECLYRGLFFTPLRRRNRMLAYGFSALVFCAIHVVGYIGAYPAEVLLLCFIQYLPAGLCLAWAYDHSGSLLAPILIHSAANLMTLLQFN